MTETVSQRLGCPIPLDEHAVSVTMPTWANVVGYEEGDAYVHSQLNVGYPRFKLHASVERLTTICLEKCKFRALKEVEAQVPSGHTRYSWTAKIPAISEPRVEQVNVPFGHSNYSWSSSLLSGPLQCMVLPSRAVARRFCDFMNAKERVEVHVASVEIPHMDLVAAYYPDNAKTKAKSFWQHTGEIISSRQAEYALRQLHQNVPEITTQFCAGRRRCSSDDFTTCEPLLLFDRGVKAEVTVRQRIADVAKVSIDNVVLTVGGMAAIYTAFRLVTAIKGQKNPVVVFGFPYLDTLKLMLRQELNPAGVHFFGLGDEGDLVKLEELLQTQKISALFTEFPSNPLLRCPNIDRLGSLARKYDFLVVVDDTISSFANVDLFRGVACSVDLLCSSLTKIFSGRGDVMAGSIVINPSSKFLSQLHASLLIMQIPRMFTFDIEVLAKNSEDFVTRVFKINSTAHKLALWLKERSEVQEVFYPGLSIADRPLYDAFLHEGCGPGYGCLISILPSIDLDAHSFYDALQLHKGPSLGTNYTLVCPYVVLAHFCELGWAKSYGLDQNLVRVSVGLEDFECLRDKFADAFDFANKTMRQEKQDCPITDTTSSLPPSQGSSTSELLAFGSEAEANLATVSLSDTKTATSVPSNKTQTEKRPQTPTNEPIADCGCLIT